MKNTPKLLAFLGKAARLATPLVPQLSGALTLVNAFLPEGSKLATGSSGLEVANAYNALPASTKNEIDLASEELQADVSMLQLMVQNESVGSNARPAACAKAMSLIVTLSIWTMLLLTIALVCELFWGYDTTYSAEGLITGRVKSDFSALGILLSAWPVVATLIAGPTTVVHKYFGERTREKLSRYVASTGIEAAAPKPWLSLFGQK